MGKEYIKVVYCHPAFLTYVQSTLCKTLGWINLKLESKLLGEILISAYHLRYADDTTLRTESKDELKSLLMKVKEERESWLKTQHSKTKIMASGPSLYGKKIGRKWKQ